MRLGWTVPASIALVLSGCAPRILVSQLDQGGTPALGVPWNLPMTQYTLTITRQVTECNGSLDGKVTVAVTQGKTVDPDMRYVLYSDGFWATSDIATTIAADGTSTGLNAQSADQTASVITNVITTAADVGMAAGSRQPSALFKCSDEVTAAKTKLNPGKGQGTPLQQIVDADSAAVTAANIQVTKLVTALQTDPSQKHALSQADEDLATKVAQLTKDQAALTANLEVVQNVQTVVWPQHSNDFNQAHAFTLAQTDALNWLFVQQEGKWQKWKANPQRPDEKPPVIPVDQFDVSIALYRPDRDGGWTSAPLTTIAPNIKVGVPVRVAGLGRLMICVGAKGEVKDVDHGACPLTLPAEQTLAENQSVPISPDARVLQLGQIYIVPMTGGTFKSEMAAIALDANGNPTSIEIAEKASVASAATGTVAAAATQIEAIPGQIAAAKLARTQAAASQINANDALVQAQANAQLAKPIAQATAQGALATAQANLATAQATAATAGPSGQLALVTAQNNLAIAQAAAAAAQANPNAQKQIDVANAQAALTQAQAAAAAAGPIGRQAVLTAESNLATAQAAADTALLPAAQRSLDAVTTQTTVLNAQAAEVNAQVTLAKANAALQASP